MNKSMLDLYKKLESQERGEKREKYGLKVKVLSFPSPFISLSLVYVFHVNILLYFFILLYWPTDDDAERRNVLPKSYFVIYKASSSVLLCLILLYLHKRSSSVRFLVYVCFPKTRNVSSLLTTLQEAISLKF